MVVYKVETLEVNSRVLDDRLRSDHQLEDFLNEKSKQGWDLVTTIVLADYSQRKIKFIFKYKKKINLISFVNKDE